VGIGKREPNPTSAKSLLLGSVVYPELFIPDPTSEKFRIRNIPHKASFPNKKF
jgi:hypothetical protein